MSLSWWDRWRLRRSIDAGAMPEADLRQQLQTDEDLASNLEAERAVGESLRRDAPSISPQGPLAARIVAELERRRASQPQRRPLAWRTWLPMLAAAAALLAVGLSSLPERPTIADPASLVVDDGSIDEAQEFLRLLKPDSLPVWMTADQVASTAADPFMAEAEALRADTVRLASFLVECLPGGGLER